MKINAALLIYLILVIKFEYLTAYDSGPLLPLNIKERIRAVWKPWLSSVCCVLCVVQVCVGCEGVTENMMEEELPDLHMGESEHSDVTVAPSNQEQ